MANKILQRRGLKANLPTLSSGEIGYATDTRETFIGTGSGNVNMGGSHWYRGTAMSGTSTTANAYSYAACPEVKVDDIYMNTSNGNIYACTTAGKGTAAKWTYQGCMKGPQGATGATGPAGESITVDSSLSKTSTNPVQNSVITNMIVSMVDKLEIVRTDYWDAYAIIPSTIVGKLYYVQGQDPSDDDGGYFDTIIDNDTSKSYQLVTTNGNTVELRGSNQSAIIKLTADKALVLLRMEG